jgi:hypothetical protein
MNQVATCFAPAWRFRRALLPCGGPHGVVVGVHRTVERCRLVVNHAAEFWGALDFRRPALCILLLFRRNGISLFWFAGRVRPSTPLSFRLSFRSPLFVMTVEQCYVVSGWLASARSREHNFCHAGPSRAVLSHTARCGILPVHSEAEKR